MTDHQGRYPGPGPEDRTVQQGTGREGAPVGALLRARADPRAVGVVLAIDLRRPFHLVTAYVHWPGHPARSGIGDYLLPLLLHHFLIVGKGSATDGTRPNQGSC